MGLHYLKCNLCDTIFFVAQNVLKDRRVLRCGGGCGGELNKISETEANAAVEEMRDEERV